jgi:hypothetical protein
MFARLALPLLGGAPAVWNTAIVFFQSALLAGYAYAHCPSRSFGPRGQIAGHLSLLALASLSFPGRGGNGAAGSAVVRKQRPSGRGRPVFSAGRAISAAF